MTELYIRRNGQYRPIQITRVRWELGQSPLLDYRVLDGETPEPAPPPDLSAPTDCPWKVQQHLGGSWDLRACFAGRDTALFFARTLIRETEAVLRLRLVGPIQGPIPSTEGDDWSWRVDTWSPLRGGRWQRIHSVKNRSWAERLLDERWNHLDSLDGTRYRVVGPDFCEVYEPITLTEGGAFAPNGAGAEPATVST